ncbi:MAG: LysR family transcriptional regulator [Bauldia sp.]
MAALQTFVSVATTGSFSEAARRLKTSKSAVSRTIGALETQLGVRLLQRTTRKLTLTEAGSGYRDRAQRIIADLEDADLALSNRPAAPRGRLKVSAPASFGCLHLAPAIPAFLKLYPDLAVDLVMSNRFVDIVEEGFDAAVRIGAQDESSLVARRLAPIRRVVCASPGYFRRRGKPKTPEDLRQHDCLPLGEAPSAREWRFVGTDGTPLAVAANGRLSINNGEALRAAALAGLGIVNLPSFIVGEDLKAGRLVSVLDAFVPQDTAVSVVYPEARHLSAKVRAFVDFLAGRFGPKPYWDKA